VDREYDEVVEQVSEVFVQALESAGELVVNSVSTLDVSLKDLARRSSLRAMEKAVERVGAARVAEARSEGFTVHRSQTIEVSCLFGQISVSSPYLRNRETGQKTRPVRDELRMYHRCKTPAVERALMDFGIEDSFQLASERFTEHYGWKVGRTSILRVVHQHASVAESYIADRLKSEPAKDLDSPPVVLVEMDGCELRTAHLGAPHKSERTPVRNLPARKRISQWRDVRLAFSRPLASEDKTFVGGMKPFDDVVEQLHQAARHQGMNHATVVAAVIDGGNGLREAIERHFGDIICVLDRPHLTAHLHEVAKAMELSDPDRHAWVNEKVGDLYDGCVASVYAELDAYSGVGQERVDQFCRHLWRFQDAVDYGFAHAWGIPQGSGEIESAHRYIPQRRLKLPGAAWHPSSINPLLAMRLVRANGWWQDFWGKHPAHQAAA